MFTVHGTKKLLDRAKPTITDPVAEPDTVLGNWYETALMWLPTAFELVVWHHAPTPSLAAQAVIGLTQPVPAPAAHRAPVPHRRLSRPVNTRAAVTQPPTLRTMHRVDRRVLIGLALLAVAVVLIAL